MTNEDGDVIFEITGDEMRIEIDGITMRLRGEAAKHAKRMAAQHVLRVGPDISAAVERERLYRSGAEAINETEGQMGVASYGAQSDMVYALRAERERQQRRLTRG